MKIIYGNPNSLIWFNEKIQNHKLSDKEQKDLDILKKLSQNYPDSEFYLMQDTKNYQELKNNKIFSKLFPNNNVNFYIDKLIEHESIINGDIHNRVVDDKGIILLNVKHILDQSRALSDNLDGIITTDLLNELIVSGYTQDNTNHKILDSTGKYKNGFYLNWFIHKNLDLPILSIIDNSDNFNSKIKLNHTNRLSDLIMHFDVDNLNDNIINIETPKFEYPNGSVSLKNINQKVKIISGLSRITNWNKLNKKNTQRNLFKNDQIIKIIMDSFHKITALDYPKNYNKWEYPEIAIVDGPKLSGKTTFIKQDIKTHKFNDDEYLIIHSNIKFPDNYLMYSDQLDLNIRTYINIEEIQGQNNIIESQQTKYTQIYDKDIIYRLLFEREKPLKKIYFDRAFLSEWVYGELWRATNYSILENSEEFQLNSLNYPDLQNIRLNSNQVRELLQQAIRIYGDKFHLNLFTNNDPELSYFRYKSLKNTINRGHNFSDLELIQYLPSIRMFDRIKKEIADLIINVNKD